MIGQRARDAVINRFSKEEQARKLVAMFDSLCTQGIGVRPSFFGNRGCLPLRISILKSIFLPTSESCIGGVALSAITARYGTPLFVYDALTLDSKWNLLRQALPSEFDISYSVKANPNPAYFAMFSRQRMRAGSCVGWRISFGLSCGMRARKDTLCRAGQNRG